MQGVVSSQACLNPTSIPMPTQGVHASTDHVCVVWFLWYAGMHCLVTKPSKSCDNHHNTIILQAVRASVHPYNWEVAGSHPAGAKKRLFIWRAVVGTLYTPNNPLTWLAMTLAAG